MSTPTPPPSGPSGVPPETTAAAPTPRDRLAILRHELRTPINHIIGYSEILIEEAEDRVPAAFLEDLRKIRSGGDHLLQLINKYLGEESQGAGPRNLQLLYHELRTPVNHIIGYSELLSEQCTDSVLAEFKPDLERVNLAARTWLTLMERELVGGTAVPNVEDRPTRIPAPASTPVSTATRRLEGRLLLADDDEGNRELLRRRLVRLGCEVVTCGDGTAVLERARTEAFDLILLDMLMPGLNGAEVLSHLKSDTALRHIPVIMISALDQMEGIVHCIELGAEDYLAKPFDPVFLRARVGAALEKKRLRDAEQRYLKEIESERAKSEWLLLNVLPRPIATRLKNGECLIVDSFPEVTVLFADLVGFTVLAAELPPSAVVKLLDEIFSTFDGLAAQHGLEKIKTIGDAYMAVAGLPEHRPDHARVAAHMALEMQHALQRFNAENRTGIAMRIGINTGPVIAGIIGRHKFAYDLWGDTVNTASRMESHAEPGTIQVTTTTASLLDGPFVLERRDAVLIKGKGQLTTFFLRGHRIGE